MAENRSEVDAILESSNRGSRPGGLREWFAPMPRFGWSAGYACKEEIKKRLRSRNNRDSRRSGLPARSASDVRAQPAFPDSEASIAVRGRLRQPVPRIDSR